MPFLKELICVVKMPSHRILFLDFVKLFAIYLVIMGHLPCLSDVSRWIVAFIYSFHMPLFMLVSGYFVSYKTAEMSFFGLLISKGKQLLLPAVTCTVFICVYLTWSIGGNVNFRTEIIGTLWFLKTLFACYVIFWIVKHLKMNEEILLIVSTLILFFFPQAASLQVNWLWPFFCGGYLLRKYNAMVKIAGSLSYSFILLFLFAVGYIIQLKYNIPNYVPINIDTLQHNLGAIFVRYEVAFSGSMSVIMLFSILNRYCEENGWFKTISKNGKYTLGVYVLQTILLERLFKDVLYRYSGGNMLLGAVAAVLISVVFLVLCLWLIHLMKKNMILDLLFFGGQYYKR